MSNFKILHHKYKLNFKRCLKQPLIETKYVDNGDSEFYFLSFSFNNLHLNMYTKNMDQGHLIWE